MSKRSIRTRIARALSRREEQSECPQNNDGSGRNENFAGAKRSVYLGIPRSLQSTYIFGFVPVKTLQGKKKGTEGKTINREMADYSKALTQYTFRLFVVGAIGAIVSIGTLFVIYEQWGEMHSAGLQTDELITANGKTAGATQAAAEANKRQAVAAEVQTRITDIQTKILKNQLLISKNAQRPWVYAEFQIIEQIHTYGQAGISFPVRITLKNTGGSPAQVLPLIFIHTLDFVFAMKVDQMQWDRRCKVLNNGISLSSAEDALFFSVFPNQTISFTREVALTKAEIDRLTGTSAENPFLELTGCISYTGPSHESFLTGYTYSILAKKGGTVAIQHLPVNGDDAVLMPLDSDPFWESERQLPEE